MEDLKDLAVLVDAHGELFTGVPGVPKNASAQANRLALALGNGVDGSGASAAQAYRNQVYAVLEQAVDEVREAARFVFRSQPKLLAPMLSHHSAEKMRRKRKQDASRREPKSTPVTGA